MSTDGEFDSESGRLKGRRRLAVASVNRQRARRVCMKCMVKNLMTGLEVLRGTVDLSRDDLQTYTACSHSVGS